MRARVFLFLFFFFYFSRCCLIHALDVYEKSEKKEIDVIDSHAAHFSFRNTELLYLHARVRLWTSHREYRVRIMLLFYRNFSRRRRWRFICGQVRTTALIIIFPFQWLSSLSVIAVAAATAATMASYADDLATTRLPLCLRNQHEAKKEKTITNVVPQ